jgi:hypothetical protein
LHSCWFILLFECGLNSNSNLNSNLFELEIRKGNKTQNQTQDPAQTSFPNPAQVYPAPAHSSLSFPRSPTRDGPLHPLLRTALSRTRLTPAQHPAQPTRPRCTRSVPLTARPHAPGPSPSSGSRSRNYRRASRRRSRQRAPWHGRPGPQPLPLNPHDPPCASPNPTERRLQP